MSCSSRTCDKNFHDVSVCVSLFMRGVLFVLADEGWVLDNWSGVVSLTVFPCSNVMDDDIGAKKQVQHRSVQITYCDLKASSLRTAVPHWTRQTDWLALDGWDVPELEQRVLRNFYLLRAQSLRPFRPFFHFRSRQLESKNVRFLEFVILSNRLQLGRIFLLLLVLEVVFPEA